MFIAMLILHFIPGGKTAGQVPLRLALESLMKEEKMQGVDNEHEMEVLARTQHTEVEHKKEENDSAVFRKGDRRIFSVSEKHLRNLRKPAKTVGMRMEVCYNITCIWLRIWMKS